MGIRPVSKTGAPGLPLQGNWRYARVPVGAPVHAPVPTLNTNDSYLTRSAPPLCPKPRVLQAGARACSASRDASVDGLYCSAVRLSGQLNVSRYSEAGGRRPNHGLQSRPLLKAGDVEPSPLRSHHAQTQHKTEEATWLRDPDRTLARTLRGVALGVLIHPADPLLDAAGWTNEGLNALIPYGARRLI